MAVAVVMVVIRNRNHHAKTLARQETHQVSDTGDIFDTLPTAATLEGQGVTAAL